MFVYLNFLNTDLTLVRIYSKISATITLDANTQITFNGTPKIGFMLHAVKLNNLVNQSIKNTYTKYTYNVSGEIKLIIGISLLSTCMFIKNVNASIKNQKEKIIEILFIFPPLLY